MSAIVHGCFGNMSTKKTSVREKDMIKWSNITEETAICYDNEGSFPMWNMIFDKNFILYIIYIPVPPAFHW